MHHFQQRPGTLRKADRRADTARLTLVGIVAIVVLSGVGFVSRLVFLDRPFQPRDRVGQLLNRDDALRGTCILAEHLKETARGFAEHEDVRGGGRFKGD